MTRSTADQIANAPMTIVNITILISLVLSTGVYHGLMTIVRLISLIY